MFKDLLLSLASSGCGNHPSDESDRENLRVPYMRDVLYSEEIWVCTVLTPWIFYTEKQQKIFDGFTHIIGKEILNERRTLYKSQAVLKNTILMILKKLKVFC